MTQPTNPAIDSIRREVATAEIDKNREQNNLAAKRREIERKQDEIDQDVCYYILRP